MEVKVWMSAPIHLTLRAWSFPGGSALLAVEGLVWMRPYGFFSVVPSIMDLALKRCLPWTVFPTVAFSHPRRQPVATAQEASSVSAQAVSPPPDWAYVAAVASAQSFLTAVLTDEPQSQVTRLTRDMERLQEEVGNAAKGSEEAKELRDKVKHLESSLAEAEESLQVAFGLHAPTVYKRHPCKDFDIHAG